MKKEKDTDSEGDDAQNFLTIIKDNNTNNNKKNNNRPEASST